MYDNAQRSLWLEQLDARICLEFPVGGDKKNVLITVSYPPSGARGALERVRPADMDFQWHGNDNEKDGFIAIHPIAFREGAIGAAKAVLYARARYTYGVRWGLSHVGLHKNDDATLTASPDTLAKLQAILTEIGDPPAGAAEPFPVRKVARGRMVKYSCGCTAVHCGSAKLDATCDKCGNKFSKV